MLFEGEYIYGKRWKGNIYDINGNLEFEIKYGCGIWKEYDNRDKLRFLGNFLNNEKNGKGENMIVLEMLYLKENI